jgi:hypothetical protein
MPELFGELHKQIDERTRASIEATQNKPMPSNKDSSRDPSKVVGVVLGGVATLAIVAAAWTFGALLLYGVVVIIFRSAFDVELWNPFH